MTYFEAAWLGGYFEGEGCITQYNAWTKNRRYMYPKLEVASTDLDTIERFQNLMGFGNIRQFRQDTRKPHYKTQWGWSVNGFVKTQAALAIMWDFLGSRRKDRAKEVLQAPMGCVEIR